MKDGGQAFPCPDPNYDGNWNKERNIFGMSLRDWFAGQALVGLLSEPGTEYRVQTDAGILIVPKRTAAPSIAYQYADAMLKAREEKP